MRLNELFNKPQRFQVGDGETGETGTDIEINTKLQDGAPLRVTFSPLDVVEPHKQFTVSFDRPKEGDDAKHYGKQGTGNEVEVMSAVVQALAQFIKQYDPTSLRFTANKPWNDPRDNSRSSLYKRMVQRLAGNLFDVNIIDSEGFTSFVLTKKQGIEPNRTLH